MIKYCQFSFLVNLVLLVLGEAAKHYKCKLKILLDVKVLTF